MRAMRTMIALALVLAPTTAFSPTVDSLEVTPRTPQHDAEMANRKELIEDLARLAPERRAERRVRAVN